MTDIVRYASPLPAPLSRAVRAGDLLFLSGQTPRGPDLKPVGGGIEAQTEAVIAEIRATLAGFGLDLSAVVRCTVWLSDLTLMPRFNAVYAAHFGAHLPARSTVEAKLVGGVDVEIEATAHDGGGGAPCRGVTGCPEPWQSLDGAERWRRPAGGRRRSLRRSGAPS